MPAFRSFAPDHPVLHTPAVWLAGAGRSERRTLLFRRTFEVPRVAKEVRLWVSASQRFVLYLDGRMVMRGPARSDEDRWNVACLELTELSPGPHTLAACVWHAGPLSAKAQLGGPGFFLLAAEDPFPGSPVATGSDGWRVVADDSRRPCTETAGRRAGHLDVGTGEDFDAASHPFGWAGPGFDDAAWSEPEIVCDACANPWGNRPLGHTLRPDPIPPMREEPAAWSRALTLSGEPPPGGWLEGSSVWILPPHARARIALDRGCLTNAYPGIAWRGGGGGLVRVVSCEAACDPVTRIKGRRDEIEGKELPGQLDLLRPSGGDDWKRWEPLWFRSFRYLVLEVETVGEALDLRLPELAETAFPLDPKFQDPADRFWQRIHEVGLRTARLCSHETFFDCPHYEQAQFPGDGRILARYHYLIANDDRLARKAIDDLHAGRTSSGLLRSHYPCSMYQIISTYSLQWIGMLHDFRVYRGDLDFLKPYLPAARGILDWFLGRRRLDGLVGRVVAPFTDWTRGFEAGNAPQEPAGGSSIVSGLLAEACGWMGALEAHAGVPGWGDRWRAEAEELRAAIGAACRDPRSGRIRDTPSGPGFSLHAQIQGVLAGVIPDAEAPEVLAAAMEDRGLTPLGTLYFKAYLFEALRRTGLRARFAGLLGPWEAHLANGLSTWPETEGQPRSDCHAWSVAPSIEFVETLLGLSPDPAANGFAAALLDPCFQDLPAGTYRVETPAGSFRWDLHEGRGEIAFEAPVPFRFGGRLLPRGAHRVVRP